MFSSFTALVAEKRFLNYLSDSFAYVQQILIKVNGEFYSQRYIIKCILIKSFMGIWDRHSCLHKETVLCIELSFSKKPSA